MIKDYEFISNECSNEDKFLELLDAKESLNEPILFSEGKNHDLANFVILNGDEAYICYLDAYCEGLKNEKYI
jgi:hypothetical protein